MKSNIGLKAFTIMEILVVLVITALLIYLGFLMLSQQRVQVNNFSNFYEDQQELSQCRFQIEQLVNQADIIRESPVGIQFLGNSNWLFQLNNSSAQLINQENQEITNYNLTGKVSNLNKIEDLVTKFELIIETQENQKYHWYFSKDYSQQTLFELSKAK